MLLNRSATSVVAALFLAAACGTSSPTPASTVAAPSSAASPAPASASAPAPTATPMPAASTAAPATPPPATEDPSASPAGLRLTPSAGQAPDLEKLLPSTVAGVTLLKVSFDGAKAAGPIALGQDGLSALLQMNGKTAADLRAATAATPAGNPWSAMVAAIQIRGLRGGATAQTLVNSTENDTLKYKDQVVGGKVVARAADDQGTIDIYVRDDVMFYLILSGGDTTIEGQIIRSLP